MGSSETIMIIYAQDDPHLGIKIFGIRREMDNQDIL